VAYTSPSNAFDTTQEVDLNLSLDDSDCSAPSRSILAVFAYEMVGKALAHRKRLVLPFGHPADLGSHQERDLP
jgi:hypothetical protein